LSARTLKVGAVSSSSEDILTVARLSIGNSGVANLGSGNQILHLIDAASAQLGSGVRKALALGSVNNKGSVSDLSTKRCALA
jgi:hypothetical protein